jgi:hypothetical protein
VPSTRAINNGAGISGGGDLTADRTLSVNQAALDPASMSSGAATLGQAPLADGLGGVEWGDITAGVTGPESATDEALARYDGATGGIIQNSGVTLTDAGLMTFPTNGNISKPSTGASSEAFGLGAVAGGSSVAVGQDAISTGGASTAVGRGSDALANSSSSFGYLAACSGIATASTAVGQGSSISAADCVAVGAGAAISVASPSATAIGRDSAIGSTSAGATALGRNASIGSGNAGAVAIGRNTVISNSLGAGIVIGDDSSLLTGATGSVLIGVARDLDKADTVAIGATTTIQGTKTVCIGQTSTAGGNNAISIGETALSGLESIAIGQSALVDGSYSTGVGQNVTIRAQSCVGIGQDVIVGDSAPESVSIGRISRVDDDGCIAIGYNARTPLNATYATVIGHDADAVATHNNAVALGRSAQTTAASRCTIGTIGGSYDLELQAGKGLGVFGVTPPGAQPTKISDPTDLASAITAISAVIDVLEGAGLSASA